jgi:tetratricopeptide (TPR) repeat protein
VDQVCEFGMSGRCYSLTALLNFGYTAWSSSKQAMKTPLSADAISTVWGASAGDVTAITEEDERLKDEPHGVEEPITNTAVTAVSTSPSSLGGDDAKERACRSVAMLLMAAQKAVDDAQHRIGLDYCNEALAAIGGDSTKAASAGLATSSSNGGPTLEVDAETAQSVQQILLLRASIQTSLSNFVLALQDAEQLISLQPTCAEGYYWQSVALQGMFRSQEALEALMSALEYDPQNPVFQHAFNTLFEEISSSSVPVAEASSSATAAPTVLHGRRSRGGQLGDALSQTTQATHLSSRSTTPTEVSAPQSRSSSQDSLDAIGAEDPPS